MDDSKTAHDGGVAKRLAALEATIDSLRREVRTQRLVVVDRAGVPRITAEVRGATAEFRVEGPHAEETGVSVLVFSSGSDRRYGLPGGGGLQLWRTGSAMLELTSWADATRWTGATPR